MRMVLLALLIGCAPPPSAPPQGSDDETAVPDDTAPEPAPAPASDWPSTLSATGLYQDIETRTLAPGVLSYEVAWPLWSDEAEKDRYLYVPPGTQIDSEDPDVWSFPVGTKAWKSFSKEGQLLETRFIEHTPEGWVWVSYQWREDGSDADPAPDGVADAGATTHDIPNEGACRKCHMGTGFLGVGAVQLGEDSPTQTLDVLESEGLLSHPIAGSTVVPGDGDTKQALGYLHGNCGGCHMDAYPIAENYTLRLYVLTGLASPENTLTYQTALNAPTKHNSLDTTVSVAPGSPEDSQLYMRMGVRDILSMPPLGTEEVDSEALQHISAWIESLAAEDSPSGED